MNSQKYFVLVYIGMFLFYGCAKSQKPEEQIPIIAWYGVQESTVERYLELKESGITQNFTFFSNVEELAVAMDAAAKAGIKMMIHCPELKEEPEKIVQRFMKHPALAGYHLVDEPGMNAFPELADLVKRIQAIDPKHYCYINLFPNYAPEWALGGTYREHVQKFIGDVPVQLLSFDHYPIVVNASGERVLRDIWYENLEIFSDEARKAGKPFWAFALTVEHGPYPIPTRAEIRLQVYSNLAYGAQGIQYFTYWSPGKADHDFYRAPINHDTKKRTEIFDYIKEINREIKDLSSVFLGAKVISIGHTGHEIPKGANRSGKLPDVIKTFDVEGEAVVSVLEKGEFSFLVIVNRDFKNTLPVRIEGSQGLQRILKNGTKVPAEKYVDRMIVDPGDILIYGWKKNNRQ